MNFVHISKNNAAYEGDVKEVVTLKLAKTLWCVPIQKIHVLNCQQSRSKSQKVCLFSQNYLYEIVLQFSQTMTCPSANKRLSLGAAMQRDVDIVWYFTIKLKEILWLLC